MSFSYIKSVFPDFNYSSVYNDKLYNNLNNMRKPINIDREHELKQLDYANSDGQYSQFNSVNRILNQPSTHFEPLQNKIIQNKSIQNNIIQNKSIEKFNNESGVTTPVPVPTSVPYHTKRGDNQLFSNIPLPNNNIPVYNNINTNTIVPTELESSESAPFTTTLPPVSMPPYQVKQGMVYNTNTDVSNANISRLSGTRETLANIDNNEAISHDQYVKHVLSCKSCKEIVMTQLQLENDRLYKEEMMELISYIILAIFIVLLLESLNKK